MLQKLEATSHKKPFRGPFTIKMYQHVNDEILSYISSGVTHHRDSAGFEAQIARGKLMMMT